MEMKTIVEENRRYWDDHADLWFGATALPAYGVKFPTEDELHLFGDVAGKRMLEVCCGSGHSLKYHGDRHAGELWGIDASVRQLANAERYLAENGCSARLICTPMETMNVPDNYFDYVYSIYGIGWTTDLQGTFNRIAACLKKDGIFIFSWNHTLHHCGGFSRETGRNVLTQGELVFSSSYFDEAYYTMPVHDSRITLCNRKISTYVNALARAGFAIEQMVEQSDRETMESTDAAGDKT